MSGLPRSHYQKESQSPTPSSSAPKNETRRENQNPSTNHLQNRERPFRSKEPVSNRRDNHQLKSNHYIRHNQCNVNVSYQKWQRMQRAAKKRHQPRNRPS